MIAVHVVKILNAGCRKCGEDGHDRTASTSDERKEEGKVSVENGFKEGKQTAEVSQPKAPDCIVRKSMYNPSHYEGKSRDESKS